MNRDPADPHNLATGREEIHQTAVIATEGMTCSECVEKVVNALRKTNGVVDAKADLASARVTVTFDRSKTDVPALHECIASTGYKPSAVPDADLPARGGL